MQRGSWCGEAAAEISRTRQRSGGINGNIKDDNSGINTAAAASGGATRRRQLLAEHIGGSIQHGMAEASTGGARQRQHSVEHGSGARRGHQPAEHGSIQRSAAAVAFSMAAEHGSSSSMAEHGGGSIQHGMVEASTGGARHGGGINRRSTAWRLHQPAEHGMAAASTGGAGRRQR
ncbi:hypothetical protein KEM48_007310 [Puccinia striiformis f. sp. tritici PST-130]|nr:hypothetical protein KEM48_007310 [Puccinia striiformis f. sp. tritici PST-130]